MILLRSMCLETKSASLLLLLAIGSVINGNTLAAFIAKDRIRTNLATLCNFDTSFLTYQTTGVLLQKITMVLLFV